MNKLLTALVMVASAIAGFAYGSSTAYGAPCVPPMGHGHPGVCGVLTAPVPKTFALGRHRYGIDVYEWNGAIPWASEKRHGLSFAIVKAGEGAVPQPYFDHRFISNWRALTRLRIPHSAYWFLRPQACGRQGDLLVARVRAVGGDAAVNTLPLVGDAEVPLPFGCMAAFVYHVERDTHRRAVVYSSPGTWPGGPHGNALEWEANYGPFPLCIWTCHRVAWQFTDGRSGPYPHCVGSYCGDIDMDSGLLAYVIHAHSKPLPKPVVHSRRWHLVNGLIQHYCTHPRGRYVGVCRYWRGELRRV